MGKLKYSGPFVGETIPATREDNRLRVEDRAAHDWYRFILSFPPHLVRSYIDRFGLDSSHLVLDPFCGTGTTLVECKKLGISSIGIEANPMAAFASRVKVDWSIDGAALFEDAQTVAQCAMLKFESQGIDDTGGLPLFSRRTGNGAKLRSLPTEKLKLLLKDSISPLPLHKTLVLLETIEEKADRRYQAHQRLALARAIVYGISNLEFGPEVGVGPAKRDVPVLATWLQNVAAMTEDLRRLGAKASVPAAIYQGDSRADLSAVRPGSVDAVITSPPYPNEKEYTRTTRLESVLLGFINTRDDLRSLKRTLVRSNTRAVYKDDHDDLLVVHHEGIQEIARTIEKRRLELGKTSGFERLYARVTKLYFGGMARHLDCLRSKLRPGARLAYVVGDQASYLRVMIRTGQLLAEIANALGYLVEDIELFRTRLATATREQLREEVVVLRWPGEKRRDR